ncbi:oxygen-regulated protein 1 [Dunckerocampus dactyliophorus]|uniref:oxygen-regulated protein 1 n=1 Tax=Dunckerocampus dactyliophorus TaxID=161453 RepID=UPI00240499A0|nr:oxygen-regulated protein 1 [Dunckerocampus dactyliophorus]
MSNTPTQEKTLQGISSASGHTLPSRSVQPTSDPSVPKRLCFYKSGDHKFSGHRMVINARTFKTFDSLLDTLSKKVPLPFGVRTITTPQGTHLVKGLDDLQDGGSYLCSDQRRVKPLNLKEVNRRQVPWNTPRAFSAGRRRRQRLQFGFFGRGDETSNRPAKMTERVAVRTPRRLVVIKNKDPTVRRTIVLQKRTAPTFDALLDYLSQILQFPVLKLYSVDGRRIRGLAALILCSGFIVAAGNEPFRLGNHSFHRTSQMVQTMFMEATSTLQARAYKNKSLSSGRGSRNFSLSSEKYIINQISKSRNGSADSHEHHSTGSPEFSSACLEACGTARAANEQHACILPHDDDIEKSFRVNQDGSMTVEMKVRLTIKEEEMLHWTTTVSRSSFRRRTVHASVTESGNISPESNIYIAKEPSNICKDEAKQKNQPSTNGGVVRFNDTEKSRASRKFFGRTPTPGPCSVKKQASVESVKMLTESGVQESTLGHYSYTEKTTEEHKTEGYCMVRHSSNSTQPVPKPRKTVLERARDSTSSLKSTEVAEVLKIENNGMEFKETVMHVYESQYNNYLVNEAYGADNEPLHCSSAVPQSNSSTASKPPSSNDIDFSWQQPTADSLQRQTEEMLSLSSEPLAKSLFSVSKNETKTEKIPSTRLQKNTDTKKASQSSLSGKKHNSGPNTTQGRLSKQGKIPSADKIINHASGGKKSSSESAKSGQNRKVDLTSTKEQNMNKAPVKDNGHNVNTPSVRPVMKKNVSDLLKLKKSLSSRKKTKSTNGNRISFSELNQSVSKISVNPTPSEIHKYVENWLEEVTPDPVTYIEKGTTHETEQQTRVLFQIGCDSETEEKNETQTDPEDYCLSHCDDLTKVSSCLSVPLCHEGPTIAQWPNEPKPRCDSVLSATVEPVHQKNDIGLNQSTESTDSADNESPQGAEEKIKTVLQQLCSSIQSTHKSVSPLEFSSNVALLICSSCKAFLSFLSVTTLRDSLQYNDATEAMLIVKSLQEISVIEDQNEQLARLTDLHSGASSQLMKCWTDFQTWREKMETEYLVAKFLEAPDAVCERIDAFDIQGLGVSELMKEMNMPYNLRAEISSGIFQGFFLPLEQRCTEINHSDVEKVVQDCHTESKQWFDNACNNENPIGKNDAEEMAPMIAQSEEKPVQEGGHNTEESEVLKVETDEFSVDKENAAVANGEDHMEQGEKAMVEGKKDHDRGETKLKETEEDTGEETVTEDDNGQKESEADTVQEDESGEEEEEKKAGVAVSEDGTIDEEQEGAGEGSVETDVNVKCEMEDQREDAVAEDEEGSSEERQEDKDNGVEKEDENIREENVEEPVAMVEEMNDEREKNIEEIEETEAIREDNNKRGKGDSHASGPLTDEKEVHPDIKQKENLAEDEVAEKQSAEGIPPVDEVKLPSQGLTEVERTDDDDEVEDLHEGCCEPNQEGEDTGSVSDKTMCKSPQRKSSEEDQHRSMEANMEVEHSKESPLKYLSDERCEEGAADENEAGLQHHRRSNILSHPVEISQELLDFVNSALQSSSLIFTYDNRGNARIELDRAEITETKQTQIPQNQRDWLYGSKCLPSPITSDLSDYRPESLESGGYQNQDSVDIVSESSEDTSDGENLEKNSKLSVASNSEGIKRGGSLSSCDSLAKASMELLSYCSKVSSLKADNDPETEAKHNHHPNDGVLIDQGRWLLKENHLIRNSPPVSDGMYRDLDSSSGQENSSEDSPTYLVSQHTPLTVISSSELEEMAKPQPPKCSYFTMPHGSDSDPFSEDASDRSRNKDSGSLKGKGFRVSPTIDTSKTWANKNGRVSSFVSVEFRAPGIKVHPEGGESSSTGAEPRGTSSGRGAVLQSQDSSDAMHVRCGQYCPIL